VVEALRTTNTTIEERSVGTLQRVLSWCTKPRAPMRPVAAQMLQRAVSSGDRAMTHRLTEGEHQAKSLSCAVPSLQRKTEATRWHLHATASSWLSSSLLGS
jgi:hypothetical protein